MNISKKHGITILTKLLMVLIAAAAVASIGWMLAIHRSDADAPIDEASQVEASKATMPKCDTPIKAQRNWQLTYAAKQAFSVCVPGGWTMNSSNTSQQLFAFPPYDIDDSKAAIIHHMDYPGKDGSFDMFWVFSAQRSYLGWADENNNQKSPFTLNDGTPGTRYYTKHLKAVGDGIAATEDAQDYEYLFEKNGQYYHAIYTVMPGTPSHLQEVESVLKTLSIP